MATFGVAFLLLIASVIVVWMLPLGASLSSASSRGHRETVIRGVDSSALKNIQEVPKPNLLLSKRLTNDIFAIGWNVMAEYELYNVGDAPAYRIRVLDEDFASANSRFVVTQGSADKLVGSLAAGDSLSFNLTARANDLMQEGMFRFQHAKVVYRSSFAESDDKVLLLIKILYEIDT
jgi:hypothetical protein